MLSGGAKSWSEYAFESNLARLLQLCHQKAPKKLAASLARRFCVEDVSRVLCLWHPQPPEPSPVVEEWKEISPAQRSSLRDSEPIFDLLSGYELGVADLAERIALWVRDPSDGRAVIRGAMWKEFKGRGGSARYDRVAYGMNGDWMVARFICRLELQGGVVVDIVQEASAEVADSDQYQIRLTGGFGRVYAVDARLLLSGLPKFESGVVRRVREPSDLISSRGEQ